ARLDVAFEAGNASVVGGELAAKGPRRVVVVQLDGRAGESEERSSLQHETHRRAEVALLGAVRFVHEHDNVPAVQLEITRLKLLHNRHDYAPIAFAQLRQQVLAAGS